jgi:DNA polymerase-3 subunit delta'
MSFDNIIGHKNITSFLEKSLKNGQIAHAYLFYGPSHLGKGKVAESFAETLLGKSLLNHPDVYFVRRERSEKENKMSKNISIEQMRELERKLSLSSFLNSYKIGIIEEAETLSIGAANSLLKTLEEPTPKTVIILLTSNTSALPATIVSRCQTLKFLPVSKEKIYEHLLSLGAGRDEALNLANISWGKPGLAINFWQSQKEKNRSEDLADYKEVMEGVLNLLQGETLKERMSVFEKIFSKEKESEDLINSLGRVLSLWDSVIRDAALLKNNCEELICNSMFTREIKRIAARFDGRLFPKLHHGIKLSGQYLKENFNSRLVLENLLLTF